MFEPFGHGLGMVLVLLTLHQLDPDRRWAIPRLVACALAAGGIADLLKMAVIRTRPYDLPLDFTARSGTRSAIGCRCSAVKAARRASPRPTRPPPPDWPPP